MRNQCFSHREKNLVGFLGFLGQSKTVMIIDPNLIKQIFIKDFDFFTDKRKFSAGNKYFDNALFNLEGDNWRKARHASTPVFTSGKLKKMSKLMKKVADDLVAQLDKFASTEEEVDAKDLSMKFTVTVIANAGFGIDANAFEPKGAQFYKMARRIGGGDRTTWDIIKFMWGRILPKFITKSLDLSFFDEKTINFFNDIIDQRVKMNRPSKTNDMVDLFKETMMGSVEDTKTENSEKFTEEEMDIIMRGNLFAMFLAGMELPATMMAGCIYFLARNQDIQERLFLEISEADLDENLEYNTIMGLPYLDMVVKEAMRHSTSADGSLVCSREYQVPGTSATISKGTRVTFSARGIAMDERYFPNPTVFNPEHFNSTNKEKRSSATDVVFSIGPRQCIGNRFAMLQLKTGIANMVSKFTVLPTSRLPDKYEADPKAASFNVKGGIWVKFERRV